MGTAPGDRDDVRQLRRLAGDGADPTLWMDKPSPGTMFLCSHGCSWISMLAMNGEYAGTVWLTEMGWVKDMYWWPSAPWRNVEPSGRLHGGWSEPVPFLGLVHALDTAGRQPTSALATA